MTPTVMALVGMASVILALVTAAAIGIMVVAALDVISGS